MKKIIYILILIVLSSCFKNKETEEKNNSLIDTWNIIENNLDDNEIDQIKNLLKDENIKNKENHAIYSQTGTQNNIQKSSSPIKVENKSKVIYPITTPSKTSQTNESSILTKEELNIIENTTDWEIDKLIDILFKNLN